MWRTQLFVETRVWKTVYAEAAPHDISNATSFATLLICKQMWRYYEENQGVPTSECHSGNKNSTQNFQNIYPNIVALPLQQNGFCKVTVKFSPKEEISLHSTDNWIMLPICG